MTAIIVDGLGAGTEIERGLEMADERRAQGSSGWWHSTMEFNMPISRSKTLK